MLLEAAPAILPHYPSEAITMRFSDGLELLLLAALWGGSFLFVRIAAPVLGPVWAIELRVLLAGLVLLPLLFKAKLLSSARQHLVPLLLMGVANSAIPFLLYAFAALSLPAGFTSILNATAPLFGTVVAAIWLREKLSAAGAIGLSLGFGGVVILVGWRTIAATPAFFLAVAAGLLAALMYALVAPYIKLNFATVPAIVVTTISQLGAALVLVPFLPFTVPQQAISLEVWLVVLALALFSTAFAYILYFRLIRNIGSTRALTVTYLIPLFAMLWGALVLDEVVTVSMAIGCGSILLGTAIVNGLIPIKVSDRCQVYSDSD